MNFAKFLHLRRRKAQKRGSESKIGLDSFWRPPLFSRIVLAPDRDQPSAPRINQVGARMFCREFREFRENREIRDIQNQNFRNLTSECERVDVGAPSYKVSLVTSRWELFCRIHSDRSKNPWISELAPAGRSTLSPTFVVPDLFFSTHKRANFHP